MTARGGSPSGCTPLAAQALTPSKSTFRYKVLLQEGRFAMPKFLTIMTALTALGAAAAAQAAPVELDLTGLRAGGRLYVELQTRDQYRSEARAPGASAGPPPPGDSAL